jgi:pimeloyl-ACP methyl ester carboxylesterase
VAEFGVPDGKPIFWFHGTPGARRQVPPNARAIAARTGLRIIGVERPGVGQSTRHLYASLSEWARDIGELADRLGVKRFGLAGLSGGGPYVLACAHGMPDRVVAGAVFGGVAPTRGHDAAAGGLVRLASVLEPLVVPLARPLGALLSAGLRALHPLADPVFDGALRLFPEGDRKVLGRPDMRAMFIDDLLRGSKIGIHSVVYDFILFSRPWGFSIRDIRVPIHFWQGDADPLVPFSHGAHQAALIPGAGLTLRPGEGHLGGLDAAGEAIEFILSHWGRPPGRLRRARRRHSVRQDETQGT